MDLKSAMRTLINYFLFFNSCIIVAFGHKLDVAKYYLRSPTIFLEYIYKYNNHIPSTILLNRKWDLLLKHKEVDVVTQLNFD